MKLIRVLAIGIAFSAGAQAAETLTLDQSVQLAVRNATVVLQQGNIAGLASTQLLQAYGQFLPNLSVGATYGYETGTSLYTIQGRSLVTLHGQTAGLNVLSTLNLFNGLADLAGLRSALARKSAAQYTLEWARQQVAIDAAQSFLQVVLDQQLLAIAQKNVVASQARLRLLQGQARVGSATLADLYRQQAETSGDAFAVTSYEAKLHDDQVLLIRKLRIDPTQSYFFQTPPLTAQPSRLAAKSVEELAASAVAARSDVRASEDQSDATGWEITRARSGYFPRLDLVFNRGANGTLLSQLGVNGVNALNFDQPGLPSQLGNQVEYTIGLNLSWSLFDRFNTRLGVAQATTADENQKVALDDSRLQAQADVRTAYVNYASAQKQVATARTGLDSAQKSYDAIEGMYEVGSASIVDVLTAQAALVLAQSNLAQALTGFELQKRSLEYATGGILERPGNSGM